MNKYLLLLALLLPTAPAGAQSRPSPRQSAPKNKAAAASDRRTASPGSARIVTRQESSAEKPANAAYVGKVNINKPVLVYYQEPAPGQSAQQLIMAEANLGLLKTLDLEQLMARREIFVDGLGNLALPGSDASKYRLVGTNSVAEEVRRPAGDGRSYFSRLKVPSSGVLYVVRESAEEYRHFVKGPLKKGYLLDFTANGLPGVDSVRAVYTLRKMDASERGAGTGETIR